jgi:hypothetical protein
LILFEKITLNLNELQNHLMRILMMETCTYESLKAKIFSDYNKKQEKWVKREGEALG